MTNTFFLIIFFNVSSLTFFFTLITSFLSSDNFCLLISIPFSGFFFFSLFFLDFFLLTSTIYSAVSSFLPILELGKRSSISYKLIYSIYFIRCHPLPILLLFALCHS